MRQFTPYEARGVPREEIERHPFPAMSRVANVYICSPCGHDEAMRDFAAEPPIPPDEWPIRPKPGSYGHGATAMEEDR
jgi:hypothetical protein